MSEEDNVEVDPTDLRDHLLGNDADTFSTADHDNRESRHSTNYKLVKTILLIFTWISFGLNFEMIGPTLEDLRILLNVNYTSISFALVLRNFGYLMLTLLFGLVLDKISKFSEVLMAIASALVALSKEYAFV